MLPQLVGGASPTENRKQFSLRSSHESAVFFSTFFTTKASGTSLGLVIVKRIVAPLLVGALTR